MKLIWNGILIRILQDDFRGGFSAVGPCLDIWAPGEEILSASIGSETATILKKGTSMAAPHVAGAAAILLGNNPSLSPIEVASILSETSAKGVVKDTGPGKGCSGVLKWDIALFFLENMYKGPEWGVRSSGCFFDNFFRLFLELWCTGSPNALLQVQNLAPICEDTNLFGVQALSPLSCQVSEWSAWSSDCESTLCGSAQAQRTRIVENPDQFCGSCPPLVETVQCNLPKCSNSWPVEQFMSQGSSIMDLSFKSLSLQPNAAEG